MAASQWLWLAPSGWAQPPPSPEQLDAKVRELETDNRKLAEELNRANQLHDAQIAELKSRLEEMAKREVSPQSILGLPNGATAQPLAPPRYAQPVPDYTEGGFAPFEPAPGYPSSNVLNPNRIPQTANFGHGFVFQSPDDMFRLQFHYESQIESRVWDESEQLPANNGIFLPRQRIFFDGHITKWIEYELAINRGLNNINLLNAYINLHLDDRFQFRFGRFFTPLPFDQYAISNYWLPTPERSPFTTNLSLNRKIGAMAWGYLLDKRLDYAAGIFNDSRNSFESVSANSDFVGYLNARPFQNSERLEAIKFLNLGTSVAYGRQDQTPVPRSFRIGGGSPDANIPGVATVPFLILNPDVSERGERMIGSVHSAWYYKSLSLIGEWQYGFADYAREQQAESTRVPLSGFYVTAGYFLTGEEVQRRARVKPLRPLIPISKDDPRGPGAIEVAGRVAQLKLGEQVFTSGLADPSLWSKSVVTTELGVNWYWNEYVKLYTFWLHGEFGEPVQYRPGRFQKSADMFWVRFQLYF